MIKRTMFGQLKQHLAKKEISLIIGPRQAGKTTLMILLKEYLEKMGEKIVWLNLDIENDKQFFISQEKLLKKIQLEIGKGKGYVFIDEIQRKDDAGLFLKGLYDMRLPYKFIISGSGSVELKEKVHESLVGRKRLFELSPLSFEEFVDFKTDYKYENKLKDFFAIEGQKARGLLEEYLGFGGYPRVVLETEKVEKQKNINEIYQGFLEKDISYLLGVQKSESFAQLTKIIASQVGCLVNFTEIANTLGVALKTVQNYLWYLQKTFILKKVSPYFQNTRKEITKSPVFYFYDLGLRNYILSQFGDLSRTKDAGFLFENLVFNTAREKFAGTSSKINFWRSKDKAEVDFVINTGRSVLPIEVKFSDLKEPEITRSLRSFIIKYQPKRAIIVNLSLKRTIKVDKTTIDFVPFFDFLFLSL